LRRATIGYIKDAVRVGVPRRRRHDGVVVASAAAGQECDQADDHWQEGTTAIRSWLRMSRRPDHGASDRIEEPHSGILFHRVAQHPLGLEDERLALMRVDDL